MQHTRGTFRTFSILGLIVLFNCGLFASASDGTHFPQSIAVLDLARSLPGESLQSASIRLAFSSDTSIVVGTCPAAIQGTQCSKYAIRWENGSSERIVQIRAVLNWTAESSADGSRRLFELSERRVPWFQHVVETLHTISTLGMSGPEDVNREVVRVIDASTGKWCFEWSRSFAMMLCCRAQFAAISPSGKLVAINVGHIVSIYSLPAVCEGSTKMGAR